MPKAAGFEAAVYPIPPHAQTGGLARIRTEKAVLRRDRCIHCRDQMVTHAGIEPAASGLEDRSRSNRWADIGAPPRNRTSYPGFVDQVPAPPGGASWSRVRVSIPSRQLERLAAAPAASRARMVEPEGIEPSSFAGRVAL
jgi:hypothetical protein